MPVTVGLGIGLGLGVLVGGALAAIAVKAVIDNWDEIRDNCGEFAVRFRHQRHRHATAWNASSHAGSRSPPDDVMGTTSGREMNNWEGLNARRPGRQGSSQDGQDDGGQRYDNQDWLYETAIRESLEIEAARRSAQALEEETILDEIAASNHHENTVARTSDLTSSSGAILVDNPFADSGAAKYDDWDAKGYGKLYKMRDDLIDHERNNEETRSIGSNGSETSWTLTDGSGSNPHS